MKIRHARDTDLSLVLEVERDAFGEEDEAELVRELLVDPTAGPLISLLAWQGERAVGHILLTHATVVGPEPAPPSMILAPLAVATAAQRAGIGGLLISRALQEVTAIGIELVFVLGHPAYYPRHGFQPAGRLGLHAPYPIPPADADAWMVQELVPGLLGKVEGKVACATALDDPAAWRE